MRNLISLFSLLILFGQIGHAGTEEYSVSAGYSADFCDDADNEICITHFDELTNGLFKEWGDGLPYGYFDDENFNVTSGLQNLYCAALSDHIGELKYAPVFYDNGMKLIDNYTKRIAVRDSNSHSSLLNTRTELRIIPKFYQSHLINDKNILKGSIFSGISNILNDADIATDGDIKRIKIEKKMKDLYKNNCLPLL